MKKTVYIPLEIEEEGKAYLRDKGYELKFAEDVKKSTLMMDIQDCDAILTRSNAMIDADVIKAGKKLKVISKYGVGLNNIDIKTATAYGIQVTTTPEANANVVAEHTIALMLTLSKRIMLMDHALRKGDFLIRHREYSEDLEDRTLGIIGLGRIGKLVAKKVYYGFDMNVLGLDPYNNEVPDYIQQTDRLDEILAKSDYVSLHLPLLESTKHFMSTNEFRQMKDTAFFINTTRGGTVDETALIKALKNKEIAGAGLDVFEKEPPELNNELFSLTNCIVTPHTAALSKTGSVKMALHAAMQVDQVLCGAEPSWPVNSLEQSVK